MVNIIAQLDQDRWTEYRQLRLKALEEIPQAFLDDADTSRLQPQEYWLQRMANMVFAEEDRQLVGMIGCHRDQRGKLNHIVNLVSFYVISDKRGQGVGEQLLRKVIDLYSHDPSVKKFQLGVIETQTAAINSYLKLGFIQSGVQKFAVRVGSKYYSEILMEKYSH